jgi:PhoPQ-activated pathogenicity-related protein
MPKLVVNAGGDEFFMPDDTHWWWKDMPDPKHFLMVPNAEHSQATGILEVVPAIGAFIRTLLNDKPAPVFTWEIDIEGNGDITVDVGQTNPKKVNMWSATTCNGERRDWRLVNID